MRTTMAERLARRREHKPNPVLYAILYIVVIIMKTKLRAKFIFKAKPSKDKGPFVLVSNHACRNDYIFTAPAVWPRRLNYVVGYNEFFRFPTALLLKIAQVIPKRNFVTDVHAMRSMMRIIDKGGHIMFMPEGMNSITGMSQPVMPGTGKLLKKLGVNVYYTLISGGYLSYTKHCLDERPGRTEVIVDKMFSPEELAALTPEQIEDKMNRLLAHDDYIWNSDKHIEFKSKFPLSKGLDTLLYMCPKCGAMHKMSTDGNTMTCTSCGNTIKIGTDGSIKPATPNDVCPKLVTDWTIAEREKAAQTVRQKDFIFTDHVKVGTLPDHHYLTGSTTSEITGEGTLTLTKEGLHYTGTIKGEQKDIQIPIATLPSFGMCTDITRFYTFVDGIFYEFYPDRGEVLLWDHLTEEMHRAQGGKWQNTPYRHN